MPLSFRASHRHGSHRHGSHRHASHRHGSTFRWSPFHGSTRISLDETQLASERRLLGYQWLLACACLCFLGVVIEAGTTGLEAAVASTPSSTYQDSSVTTTGATRRLELQIVDAESGEPLAARVYLKDTQGQHFFFKPLQNGGHAVRYEVQNWINETSIEYHTTVSAHRCVAEVPAGRYELLVERGKTWFPAQQEVDLRKSNQKLTVRLRRWINPATSNWYSGDTHLHRSVEDLRTILLAENLNVGLPLTHWVTRAKTPPTAGDKNLTNIPEGLVELTPQHVIWPLNTEYEIFTVNQQAHTLGAFFVLGQREPLSRGVPPWQPVIEEARTQSDLILFDMDKLDWPFAMLLPTIAPDALYELANNHVWRTEFAFREWNMSAPPFLNPPFGGNVGGHREWLDYTLGMYYTLLNTGLRLPPSAGTANGVHPVPAGFSRVYVHLPGGFSFESWMRGLKQGRSFVTTGPMLDAKLAGQYPGHVFQLPRQAAEGHSLDVQLRVDSAHELLYGEVLVNGRPELLLRPQNQAREAGGFATKVETSIPVNRSGWVAIRWWEEHPSGQVRFAHTAPWYVKVGEEPVRIARHEKEYLVERMQAEIERSREVLSADALTEYERGLDFYRQLPELSDQAVVEAEARQLTSADREKWLDNMVVAHRFTPHEVRRATGLDQDAIAAAFAARDADRKNASQQEGIQLLPYPGGRHPRRGFLDGAIAPQRETKVSLFPPWKESGYVVVDVPEAIFSNLGLTFLAHQHIPTIWDDQGIELEPAEWSGDADQLQMTRRLPNGIEFTSQVQRRDDGARMTIQLTNGTEQPLTGLRVQVCNHLPGAVGFENQEELEHIIAPPCVAVRARNANRWIIAGWTPSQRVWTNPPVPCVHADPIFPDCPAGETVEVKGGLWFYEGDEIQAELQRRRRELTNSP